MPRFDVYTNPDTQQSKEIPFYIDVQSDHIKGIETRMVVALWNADFFNNKFENLNPEFELFGQRLVMDALSLGAVPRSFLKRPVANLAAQQMQIQDAIDTLFGSY
jgi:toxin CcdB